MRPALCAAALTLTAACGSRSALGNVRSAAYVAQVASSAYATPAKHYLYVGETGGGGYFDVYRLPDLKRVREYQEPWGAKAIAIDPWGDVYITSSDASEGQLIAFTPGGGSILLTINNVNFGSGVAITSSGDVYVTQTFIEEYAPRSTKLLQTIKVRNSAALAVDTHSNLYAAVRSERGGEVLVFPPGSKKPVRTITKGIDVPYALLLDKSDDLFVANCPSCYGSGGRNSVTEYPPGSITPTRTITNGITNPSALALGVHGLLFVSNNRLLRRGDISVYGSGSHPVRTITKDVDGPDALAVGPHGGLYVANCHTCNGRNGGTIAVYSPDGSEFLRVIKDGFIDPAVMAIGGSSDLATH